MEFDLIKIGDYSEYSQTITDADIKAFAGLCGDRNPVHLDEIYASSSRYKKRISHGMLAASFFSQIFGTKLPGEGCVYASQTLQFRRPIYLGDTVLARVEVVQIDALKRRIKFKTTILVKDGGVNLQKPAITGEAEIFVP